MDIENYIGCKYGRLTIVSYDNKKGSSHYVNCQCDCGNTKSVRLLRLKSGETKSCGCIRKELFKENKKSNTTHGQTDTRLYNIYRSMKARCYRKTQKDYHSYGGRGIKVCDEWLNDFMNFYSWSYDNGYNDNLTIDRIDNNGNYEPNNCRWITEAEQHNNTSRNINITYNGETKTLKQWSKIKGINYDTLKKRYKMGWSIEDMLTKPVKRK
ncbi:hypothetical protein C5023_000226 [Staphylococcus phage vB_SauM_0414_108]|nr:hypothetical protein C5023_000002 [Staphylococcus phage vB_SauM_0414_108]AVX47580.1 hypothetical protein C5023_000226 [Staphylococcus phage vB_SauM_0414_108]